MKLSRRTLLSTPLAVVAPVGEIETGLPQATWRGIPFPFTRIVDHSELTGLADDDSTQYVFSIEFRKE